MNKLLVLAVLALCGCEQPCVKWERQWVPEITHTHSHHLIPTTYPAHWADVCTARAKEK